MAEGRYDDLVRDLATLGRGIDPPVPPKGLATAVMDRVAALPMPDRPVNAWTRVWRRTGRWVADIVESRRRRIALVVGAVLLALLATPPVRAAVVDWFGFGGVRVERGPSEPSAAQPPPEVAQDWSVSDAAAAVDFTLSVPEELGDPDGVEVSPDRRLVSMSWATDEDGVVRLDQFDARFDFSVLKRAPGVFYAAVGGTDALWFEEPHEVVLLEPDGSRRTEPARLAGHTLIWLDDVTTLRLEGDLSLERAVEIAESCVTVA
ncbi:MAG: hypothetical protein ABWY81_03020 [Jiangellaceae bacterium]